MLDSESSKHPLLNASVVYQLPYEGEVRRAIPYGHGPRYMDLYLPEHVQGPTPVVILLTGYPDSGFESHTGKKQSQLPAYTSWARLLAASGMAAVVYSNVEANTDAFSLIEFLKREASRLQIDPDRLAIWACSGNVPNALNIVHGDSSIRCAVLLYGFMLDTTDVTVVADTASAIGFANPNNGMENFPENTPLFIVKAGKEENPGLNQSIDLFEAEAIARNSPVSVVHYEEGVHAFDILDDSQRSIEMIKLSVQFLRLRLGVY